MSRPNRLSRFVSHSLVMSILLFGSLIGALASEGIGTGPHVDPSFVATPFDVEGQPDAVFVVWRDAQASIHSGLLRLDDGSFAGFPIQPTAGGYLTNLTVGSGGRADERRAYVLWVGGQLDLTLLVYDEDGSIISPLRTISNSVQVVPVRVAGTDSGALVAYAWDSGLYWDPRILTLGLDGSVLGSEVVGNTSSPEQTLGVSVAATPDGTSGVVYVVSDTHLARIRRYDANAPVDPAPVEFFGNAAADYVPYAALFSPSDEPPFMLIAVPALTAQSFPDLRFAYTRLGRDEVALGPGMSELVPEFVGGANGFGALAGSPEHAVVLWQEIKRQQNCGCSVPPPIRIEFFAQVLLAANPPQAVGRPFTVYRWDTGDPIGPPVTDPVLVASTRTPGHFTVLWSDGSLRYKTIGVLGPATASLQQNGTGTVVRWADVPAAVSYNVIRGQLENVADTISAVYLGPVVCVEAASADASTEGSEDEAAPASGKAFFYLVEAVYADGSSDSYGRSSTGKPRLPGSGDCP